MPLIRWLVVVVANVTAAALAGLEARLVVRVRVARLFVASYDTPPVATVYVPVTPVIVNVSPASGVLCMLPIISEVPV
jgi:hypothetical protein